MIVRCDNCGTEFGFDDKQIGDGITVRCSVCKHVFKVESPSAAAAGWMIHTTEDADFSAPDVATLRQWIGEGRLHPDDQVSRTGRNWVRFGDMPEFADAFAGFDDIAPVVQAAPELPPRQPVAPIHPPIEPPAASAPARPPAAPPPSPIRPHTREGVISTMPPIPPRGLTPPPAESPQSMRPTVSPPRSVPPQAAAPVAVGEDALLESDDGDDEPTAARSRGGFLAENSDEFEQAPTQIRDREPSRPRASSSPSLVAADASSSAAIDSFESNERKGISPAWIVVGLLVVGVGVVFGVPQLREQVMGLISGTEAPAEEVVADRPEFGAAAAARQTLGVAQTAKAEADLQRAIDAGDADPATMTAMKVARADLLLSRALVYEMAAALDPEQRADFQLRASEDQEDGERIVDSVEGGTDPNRLAEVRALARLAGGRAETEVMPLVPEDALETRLVVEAAVLWRDPKAPVPKGVVSGLLGLGQRTALGESALALGLLRAGDDVGARDAANRLIAGASDHSVGLAVRARLDAIGSASDDGEATSDAGEPAETGGETGDEPSVGDDVSKPPPPPEGATTGGGGGEGGGGEGGGGGGGGGFARLLEKGCDEVNSGNYRDGIATLLKASDKRPDDFKLQLCLGRGYLGYGSAARALEYFETALETAPKSQPALIGAGKAAARSGAKQKATTYYERLLAIDPNNGVAKAYLDKQAKPEPEPAPGDGEG